MEQHFIQLENKKKLTVTEVTSVEAFDEETILVNLTEEGLVISGEDLHIEVLDLEEGRLTAKGVIQSIAYTRKKNKIKFFDRFKK